AGRGGVGDRRRAAGAGERRRAVSVARARRLDRSGDDRARAPHRDRSDGAGAADMTSPDAGAPDVSIVVTTRNDDHGGDPLKRLQAFVNTLAAQCRESALDAEVIVVEWNPPIEKPRVRDLIRLPADAPFDLRFIEVPPDIHARL